jgi:hypothetical protein
MAIDPLSTPGVPDPGLRRSDPSVRSDAPAPVRNAAPAENAPESGADSVELSAEAMRLAAGADIPSGTLSPERLAAITQRLADGGFDTPEAHDAIARALTDELAG